MEDLISALEPDAAHSVFKSALERYSKGLGSATDKFPWLILGLKQAAILTERARFSIGLSDRPKTMMLTNRLHALTFEMLQPVREEKAPPGPIIALCEQAGNFYLNTLQQMAEDEKEKAVQIIISEDVKEDEKIRQKKLKAEAYDNVNNRLEAVLTISLIFARLPHVTPVFRRSAFSKAISACHHLENNKVLGVYLKGTTARQILESDDAGPEQIIIAALWAKQAAERYAAGPKGGRVAGSSMPEAKILTELAENARTATAVVWLGGEPPSSFPPDPGPKPD